MIEINTNEGRGAVFPKNELSGEISSLDGWRAVAVLLVFVGHVGHGYISVPGGLGVTIFFFFKRLFDYNASNKKFNYQKKINISNFYIRRFLRITPPLVLVLIATYILTDLGILIGAASLKSFFAQLLYFANYYSLFFGPNNLIPSGTAVFWSLAVEEHFYLLFPGILLFLLRRYQPSKIATILIFLCIFILLWRIYLVYQPGFYPDRTYYATDTRIDSIMYGSVLALFFKYIRLLKGLESELVMYSMSTVCILCLIGTLLIRNVPFRETVRYSIQGVVLIPLFYYSIIKPNAILFRLLNSTLMKKIGIYSYSIYLIHEIVFDNCLHYFKSLMLSVGVTIFLSFSFAVAIDKLLEPFLRQLRAKYR